MLLVEPNLNVFPKATAVVIPRCLGITKSLRENTQKALSTTWSFCVSLCCRVTVTSMMGLEARTLSSTLASLEEQLTVAK